MLWAVGMMIALGAIGLLVAKLYPSMWEDLSRERVATLIGIGVALTVIIVLLAIGGASLGWTGFGDKTLWDWVQLLSALAIPLVLAIAGFWFTTQQDKSAREIEEQRAQEAALQAYLDQMSTLMLDTDQDLRNSEEDSEVQTLARARTATVIQRLDADGNRNVIRFLKEANLTGNLTGDGQSSISLLAEADLQGAHLEGVDLSTIDLSGTNLSGAYLSGAYLSEAYLDQANLSYADLSYAEGITKEMLEQKAKSLRGATMPDRTVLSELYATRVFEPALSLKLGHGWQLGEEFGVQETPDMLFIGGPGGSEERGSLKFTSPVHVFDSSNPSERIEAPAPDNADGWASWFRKHPNLDTCERVPMSVDGASGVRIDVTTPENSSAVYCGGYSCVHLFPAGGDSIVS